MTSPNSKDQDASHPLAKANLPILKHLQAQGQTVGTRGHHMQITGYFHWGFIIYRCDYSDDAIFDRFIAFLREHANKYHERAKQDRTTALYLRWTIVQDREMLDGATKAQVRERFGAWREGPEQGLSAVRVQVERDGAATGAEHRVAMPLLLLLLPRFEYCIHVGRDSLESLEAYEKAAAAAAAAAVVSKKQQEPAAFPPVVFALVRAEQRLDGLLEDTGLGDDEEGDECDHDLGNVCPAVEGLTEYDVGWMYVKAEHWVTLYEELHDDQAWYHLYTRPPAIVKF